MKGIDQLSYCAARMRKTNTMARPNTTLAIDPALSSWSVMPVHSKEKSRGSAGGGEAAERAQRHHAARGVADVEPRQSGSGAAAFGVGLQRDAEGAAEQV